MTSKLASLPVSLPVSSKSSTPEEAAQLGRDFESRLGSLGHSDFAITAVWRDLFALTGSLRTFYGSDVVTTWQKLSEDAGVQNFTFKPASTRVVRVDDNINWIDVSYSFETTAQPPAECTLILSITYTEDAWKIWCFRTILDKLKNHPSIDEFDQHTAASQITANGTSDDGHLFDCVVVGAGQAGLSVAGRLKSQGIDYVILDTNARVGDNWRNRYRSVKLHTTRESSHLPFNRTFPPSYREWLSKDDLAEGYENWSKEFNIRVWGNTSLVKGSWLEDENAWALQINRNGEGCTIKAKHVVMAVGAGCQIPVIPFLEDKSQYKGIIQHSSAYTSADDWKGKKGVVVGTANTAHDVADDMVVAGLSSVEMVQRSPTYVLPAEYYQKIQDGIYNDRIDTTVADTLAYTNPIAVSRLTSMLSLHKMADQQPERFDSLEKAGFKLIRHGDIIFQLYERFGGHYMDVGTSAKISKGLIKMKSDAFATRYYDKGLIFDDGSKVEADVIVFATGFVGNMSLTIQDLFSDEIAARVDDFWGLDSEGEIRGAYRPSGHPRLWLHGGTCGQARYFSRFIGLQIRASLDGTPLRIFSEKKQYNHASDLV